MKTIVTPFHTTEPKAGAVKRSNEYSTPTTTPAEVSRSTVGMSMRIICHAQVEERGVAGDLGEEEADHERRHDDQHGHDGPHATITKVSSFEASA